MKSRLLSKLGFKFIGLGAVIVLALSMLGMTAMVAGADDTSPPHRFCGLIINADTDMPAPGVVVSAWIDGELKGSLTTDVDGNFGHSPLVGWPSYLNVNGDSGDIIQFKVDGEPTVKNEWGVFNISTLQWDWQTDLSQPIAFHSDEITWLELEYTPSGAPVNSPPVLNDIASEWSKEEGELLEFTISATDPNDDPSTLTFSADNLPGAVTLATFTDNDDGTATFSWTPADGDAGTYTDVHFEVEDDGGLTDFKDITITIYEPGEGPTNNPPELGDILDQAVDELVLLEFTISATDPDAGDTLTFTYSAVPALPTGLLTPISDTEATFSWTPADGDAGTYIVTFTVEDDGDPQESDSQDMTINVGVGGVNNPPELGDIPDQAVDELVLLEFTISATDPDVDDTLTFTYSAVPALPTGLLTPISDTEATFSWTPADGDAGTYVVTFTVEDDGDPQESDSQDVTINVGASGENDEPILSHISTPKSVEEGQTLTFSVIADDPEGDPLILSVSTLGSHFTDNGDGTGTFSWTTAVGDEGTYNITFTVTEDTDDELYDSQIVTINVTAASDDGDGGGGGAAGGGGGGGGNQSPVLASIGNKTVAEGQLLSFTISATDADDDLDELTFTAQLLPFGVLPSGVTFTDNGDGTADFSWSPTSGQAGTYNIRFRVDDGTDGDREDITITVNEPEPETEVPPEGGEPPSTTTPATPPTSPTSPTPPTQPATPPSGTEGTPGTEPTTPTLPVAIFTFSNLTVSPDTVAPDETVTITVDVVNTGESEDSYNVVLKLNGVEEATQSVTLAAGQEVPLTFSVTKSEAGSYTVEINGLSATFDVVQPVQLVLILGVIGGVIVLGLIVWFIRRLYFLKTGM